MPAEEIPTPRKSQEEDPSLSFGHKIAALPMDPSRPGPLSQGGLAFTGRADLGRRSSAQGLAEAPITRARCFVAFDSARFQGKLNELVKALEAPEGS